MLTWRRRNGELSARTEFAQVLRLALATPKTRTIRKQVFSLIKFKGIYLCYVVCPAGTMKESHLKESPTRDHLGIAAT